jgi:hypothetical protein
MKNNLFKIAKGLLVLLITVSTMIASAQDPKAVATMSLAPDITGLAVGDIVHVSVRITTATGPNVPINSAVFYIDYNQSVLSPLGPAGYTPVYVANANYYDYNPYFGGYGANRLYLAFYLANASLNVNFNNTQLVTLDFIYLGGTSTTMHLRHSPDPGGNYCSFFNALGNAIPVSSFVDNTVSGAASGTYDLHSLATGGPFDWFDPNSWVEAKTPTSAANVFITGEEVQIFYNDPPFAEKAKCHNVTIYPAGQLTLNPTYPLTVSGTFTVQADATHAGSYVDLGGPVTITGPVSVSHYYTGNWVINTPPIASTIFHYTSTPVTGGTASTFLNNLLNTWTESTQTWINVVPPTTSLIPGKGYSAATTAGSIKTFTGTGLNTGDLAITGLTRTTSTTPNNPLFDGFNLIGNPFPSAVQYKSTWTKSNLTGSIYVWDPTTGNYKTTTGNLAGTLLNDIIPSEQGFFVRVTSGTGSITIANADRLHANTTFYKTTVPDMIYLTVQGNSYEDAMVVRFDPAATDGFDNDLDATKLPGLEAAPQLYSIMKDNTKASINVLPGITGNSVISLGFKAGVSATYTLTASQLESFAGATDIYLEDLITSNTVNLNSNPVYTFNATPNDQEHRFNLHFGPLGVPQPHTGIGNIYSENKDIYINIPGELQGNITVYNLLGNELASKQIVGNSLNKISLSVPTGYYLVKVISDRMTTTSKVFIR